MVDPKTLSEVMEATNGGDSCNTGHQRPGHQMNQRGLTTTDSKNDSYDGSLLDADIMPDLIFENQEAEVDAVAFDLENYDEMLWREAADKRTSRQQRSEDYGNDSRDGNPKHGDVMAGLMIQNYCAGEKDTNVDPFDSCNSGPKTSGHTTNQDNHADSQQQNLGSQYSPQQHMLSNSTFDVTTPQQVHPIIYNISQQQAKNFVNYCEMQHQNVGNYLQTQGQHYPYHANHGYMQHMEQPDNQNVGMFSEHQHQDFSNYSAMQVYQKADETQNPTRMITGMGQGQIQRNQAPRNKKEITIAEIGRACHNKTDGQICPDCGKDITSKNTANAWRDLADHVVNKHSHFKQKVAKFLPNNGDYSCPHAGQDKCRRKKNEPFASYQTLKRHYIGTEHGFLISWIDEWLEKKGIRVEKVNNKVVKTNLWNGMRNEF